MYLSTIHLSDEEDLYEWTVNGTQWDKFKTGSIYSLLKRHAATVPWYQTIWCKRGIPKHNFLSWLFVLNRCPTRDRLLSWGLNVDPTCLLCNAASESRDHLLFDCPYSWEIWSSVTTRCSVTSPRDWPSIVSYLTSLRLPKPHKKLLLIAWQCSIYLLWTERNSRIHRGCFRPPQSLLATLDLLVRNRCSSLRSQNPATTSLLATLTLNIFSHTPIVSGDRFRNHLFRLIAKLPRSHLLRGSF